ncbi:hypothetical protein Taro_018285, partial [Colocasia esculenta]|nr:hypothetical protein [Colocasia esculenta]
SSLFCPEELGGGLWPLTQGQRHGRWTPSMIWASRDLAVESGSAAWSMDAKHDLGIQGPCRRIRSVQKHRPKL